KGAIAGRSCGDSIFCSSNGLERRELLCSVSLRSEPLPAPFTASAAMLHETPRDLKLLDLLLTHRALTDTQIQTALFTPANAPGCQRRLTALYKHHWIDRLPPRSVNEPSVY